MSILDKITASASSGVMSGDKNSTIIGENCVIEGDVTFEKTIEIHGKIVGTVKVAETRTYTAANGSSNTNEGGNQ